VHCAQAARGGNGGGGLVHNEQTVGSPGPPAPGPASAPLCPLSMRVWEPWRRRSPPVPLTAASLDLRCTFVDNVSPSQGPHKLLE